MIILDTNVLSEITRANPDSAVLLWFNQQQAAEIWITSVTLFEIQFGIARLPSGRKRESLARGFAVLMDNYLSWRVAPVDRVAAEAAAHLAARREVSGLQMATSDTLIAGIVTARRATFATRNIRHFADLQTPVINPWDYAVP